MSASKGKNRASFRTLFACDRATLSIFLALIALVFSSIFHNKNMSLNCLKAAQTEPEKANEDAFDTWNRGRKIDFSAR
jgi:hypothetical protein